ncbi:MAG: TonB-dependent receptor [Ignavibacteria bacterium]
MLNKFYLAFLCFISINTFSGSILHAQEQETIYTDEITITATKIPVSLSETPRSIIVLSPEEIKRAPVQNLQDLLSYYSGVDVKKRGPEGVQADISIRGGSFEQTLFLLDGIRISDSQTGHNNLNIPVNLEDVDRIEILKGQASGIYGPNALSGVINIITKKDWARNLSMNLSGGDFGYYRAGASIAYPIGDLSNRFSFSKAYSDGYRHNTSFSNTTFAYNSALRFNYGTAQISAGYNDKRFGANGFYSDKYPDQWERIKTLFVTSSARCNLGMLSINPKLYWRRNRDNYLLDYTRPDFYNNLHITNSYGIELQSVLETSTGSIMFGGEYGRDEIESNNLGNHERSKGGLSGEYILSAIKDLKIVAAAFAYNYDNFGWKFWPGIDAGYKLTQKLHIYSSIGKSFRVPNFTELYYNSPVQKGNVMLQPEEAVSVEAGLNYTASVISGSLAVFNRSGNNFIDWVRESSDKSWFSANIADITTKGFEAGISLHQDFFSITPINSLSLNYTFIESDMTRGTYQSKYILDHLKHQVVLNISHNMPVNMIMTWVMKYESRFNQNEYFIADAKLSLPYKSLSLFIEASNLFDKHYAGTSGIPMPGRWVMGGLNLNADTF